MSNRVRSLFPGSSELVRGGYDWGSSKTTGALPNVGFDGLPVLVGDLASVGGVGYRCAVATSGSASWTKQGSDTDIVTAQMTADTAKTSALAAQATADAAQTDLDLVAKTYGEMYLTSSAETTIATQNTPVKVAGTTALGTVATALNFDMPANNKLRYIGAPTMVMHCALSWSATAAANNKTYNFYVYLNGVKIAESVVRRKIAIGADVGSSAIHTLVEMEQNEYLEMFVECTDATTANMTMVTLNMFCMGMRL